MIQGENAKFFSSGSALVQGEVAEATVKYTKLVERVSWKSPPYSAATKENKTKSTFAKDKRYQTDLISFISVTGLVCK